MTEPQFVQVTAKKNLVSICAEGLRAGVYLVHVDRPDIRDYYAETVSDEGELPVTIEVLPAALDAQHLEPDLNGIEEPLTYTLRMSEEEVWEAWERTDKSWTSSVELIGTARYMAAVPAHQLLVNGQPLASPCDAGVVRDSAPGVGRRRMRP